MAPPLKGSNFGPHIERIKDTGLVLMKTASIKEFPSPLVYLMLTLSMGVVIFYLVMEYEKKSAFQKAAERGDIEKLSRLLAKGVSVDAQDEYEATALFQVANTATMKWLIDHGADVNHRDKYGRTALFFAKPEMVDLLIDHGADMNIVSPKFGSALLFNIGPGSVRFPYFEALLKRGMSPDGVTSSSESPLIYAITRGHYPEIEFFITHGANVNARSQGKDAKSALDWARIYQNQWMIDLLIKNGAH